MKTPAFAHTSNKDELWVRILEKAIAKYLGSYQSFLNYDKVRIIPDLFNLPWSETM